MMANDVVAIGEETKSQKPSSSAFKQQKLPAWQPILTAGTVLPTFFLIGVAFIPIGVGLLVSSNQVQEHVIDYTFCTQDNDPSQTRCADLIAKLPGAKCICKIEITLPEDFKRDVFIYYGMSNYYQNHRRYVKSRDDRQLLGYLKKEVSSECKPYDYVRGVNSSRPIAPCGAIANSMFNDSFVLEWQDGPSGPRRQVPLTQTAIAWATDKSSKFRNPSGSDLKQAFKGYSKPFNWQKNVWEFGKLNETDNNGFRYEPFIVWMRTAALPTFRKIYARVAHDKTDGKVDYSDHLPLGTYILTVNYNYPVLSFKGSKKFIISNTSWLGGKNPFLGITYMFVGCICLVLTLIFAIIHKKYGKSTNELLTVTSRTPYMN